MLQYLVHVPSVQLDFYVRAVRVNDTKPLTLSLTRAKIRYMALKQFVGPRASV
ncbi:hypothetical protein BDM02DRAFT_3114273 [Thelephora ganbajun]|uniref:Uncharacterized protein n=1 Tax=Thelephora ganbajun TaxID=370292 RepID=A0ACB6ZII3_THEGA|nr:hypothetical protein BDM02DRAFT_3114273 [Thelephora ganbajun]